MMFIVMDKWYRPVAQAASIGAICRNTKLTEEQVRKSISTGKAVNGWLIELSDEYLRECALYSIIRDRGPILSATSVADILGIGESTVRAIIKRCNENMRKSESVQGLFKEYVLS